MVEYRLVLEEEFEQAIQLADTVFRKEGHVSMGIAFPHVFSSAFNQSYGAFIDGKLVSFIGLVPSVLQIEGSEVYAYSIGAVCTDPEHRRKGHANRLLQMVFDHIQLSKSSLLFVSGALPIYLKQGCNFYGKQIKYHLQEEDIRSAKQSYTIRELHPFDWFKLRELANARPVRYEQSIFDLAYLNEASGYASIFKMKNKIIVAEKDSDMKAYLIFGEPYKVSDGDQSKIIEWGGDAEAIVELLESVFSYGVTSLDLQVPKFETNLLKQLQDVPGEEAHFPGTMKIINLDILLQQLQPYFKGKIKIEDIDEVQKRLITEKDSYIVSVSELEELIMKGSGKFADEFGDLFPIPFPYPQGLNYV